MVLQALFDNMLDDRDGVGFAAVVDLAVCRKQSWRVLPIGHPEYFAATALIPVLKFPVSAPQGECHVRVARLASAFE